MEREMFMFMLRLNKNFTDEDKENCFPIIRRLCELVTLVRRNGLAITLETEIPKEQNFFLKKGLELLLRIVGANPDTNNDKWMTKMLQNLILSENYSGSQLLEKILIMEFIFALYYGYNQPMMLETLTTILGENYLSEQFETSDEYFERIAKITANKK